MSSNTLTFDYATFIAQIPAYSNATIYPQATLQMWWNIAINYISDVSCGDLQGASRQYAIDLMMAHLIYIANLLPANNTPGFVTQATIDKVSVGLLAPPVPNQWQWWLNTSPYGQQLLALLLVNSAGGYYVGGTAPRDAFGYQGGSVFPSGGCC
jgi:hypothetical protein